MFKSIVLLTCILISSFLSAQLIPNGTIDNLDELSKKETYYIPMSDGTLLGTDVSVPVFRDSVVTSIEIDNVNYLIQIIPKGSQYIVYDTTDFDLDSYRLPVIYTRSPYNKNSDDIGGVIFPFLGYAFAIQDMRGRYSSEGVYFPMFSDSWQKAPYTPTVSIPMDVTNPSDPEHALNHKDGYDGIFYLADSVKRISDFNLDGIEDTVLISNGNIGMYGASALGNSQYQLLSSIPHSENHPVKSLMPIVAANEHYNSTLTHNGVYRQSLATGWILGQLNSGLDNSLNATDNSIYNDIHSPSDYGYTDKITLAQDLIDWYVSNDLVVSPSGIHPDSHNRMILDASKAPVNALGQTDDNGSFSRYSNLNKPMYHLTGWWDIFINGQIETFNETRKEHPNLMQKIVIGPWTHQTIGSNEVGDVVYPDNVFDLLNFNLDFDPNDFLTEPDIINQVYSSEMVNWFRSTLGGEPFFIIPESDLWQSLGGSNLARIPSENYIIPYYQFLNFLGGVGALENIPIELDDGTSTFNIQYDVPALATPLFSLSSPLQPNDTSYFEQVDDIRMYISGPTNDPANNGVGNFWYGRDSLPFENGVSHKKLFLHQNQSVNDNAPTSNEGTLSYTADPNDPVVTIGGNNMIPNVPNGSKKSQGSMDLADPNYINHTMNRNDVLSFETDPLTDTMTVIGFPKAGFYAKGHTTTHSTSKTDFDIVVRVLDVYPDGREMFITEGVVNARARDYALSITEKDTNDNIQFSNVDNNTYYYFEFDLLPMGHTFGVGHQIKFLLSSSNYPKYQSNPHLPNEDNEFFRWDVGQNTTYNYQGNNLSPQNADITYEFRPDFPAYVSFPQVVDLYAGDEDLVHEALNCKLYPNPNATGVITVETQNPYKGEVMVLSVAGEVIQSTQIKSDSERFELDLQNLPAGVYMIHLKEINQTARLIVR